jgi:hypothetical protein
MHGRRATSHSASANGRVVLRPTGDRPAPGRPAVAMLPHRSGHLRVVAVNT